MIIPATPSDSSMLDPISTRLHFNNSRIATMASVHACGDAPPHIAPHAHGERPPRDDAIAGGSAATDLGRVCAGESPPRRSSAFAKEPGVSQSPSRRSLYLYQRRARGSRRSTKEDHGLASPPDRPPDGSTLTDMASTLKQQQRVLDELTTSVQELRIDVRKTQQTSAAAVC